MMDGGRTRPLAARVGPGKYYYSLSLSSTSDGSLLFYRFLSQMLRSSSSRTPRRARCRQSQHTLAYLRRHAVQSDCTASMHFIQTSGESRSQYPSGGGSASPCAIS
jgi:type II secretory pathway component PulJ